jgi:hypothetical protein
MATFYRDIETLEYIYNLNPTSHWPLNGANDTYPKPGTGGEIAEVIGGSTAVYDYWAWTGNTDIPDNPETFINGCSNNCTRLREDSDTWDMEDTELRLGQVYESGTSLAEAHTWLWFGKYTTDGDSAVTNSLAATNASKANWQWDTSGEQGRHVLNGSVATPYRSWTLITGHVYVIAYTQAAVSGDSSIYHLYNSTQDKVTLAGAKMLTSPSLAGGGWRQVLEMGTVTRTVGVGNVSEHRVQDCFHWSNRELTEAEIQTIYNMATGLSV